MASNHLEEDGQILLETQWVLSLILIPLLSGLFIWGNKEYEIAKCSYENFFRARNQMILSQAPVRSPHLETLEDLDQTHGAGLSLSDYASEVSRLSEALSSLSQSLREPGSP